MNCRGSDTYAASGNTPSLQRALERHAMPERLMMEDAALAEEARNGNAAAFVKLAKRWWTPLYRVSWNISGRSEPAFTAPFCPSPTPWGRSPGQTRSPWPRGLSFGTSGCGYRASPG
jgi:hypothetical protein